MLGLFSEMPYDDADVDLRPGDVLVAFTDGVTEARNAAGDEFGEDRLKDLLREAVGGSADDVSSRVTAQMRACLIANDNATDVSATLRFLLQSGGAVTHPVTVPARARVTVHAGSIPALVDTSFGIEVIGTQPIIVERSMYFPSGGARLWEGGTEAAGVNATSTHWFLAEALRGRSSNASCCSAIPTAPPRTRR